MSYNYFRSQKYSHICFLCQQKERFSWWRFSIQKLNDKKRRKNKTKHESREQKNNETKTKVFQMRLLPQINVNVWFFLGIIFNFIFASFFFSMTVTACKPAYWISLWLRFFFLFIVNTSFFTTSATHCQGGVTLKVLREHA